MNIILPLPPTDNLLYRIKRGGGGLYMTDEAKKWKTDTGWEVKASGAKYTEDPVIVGEIHIYLKTDRDTQGGLKLLFDAMEGVYYKNDRQVIQFGPVFKHKDKENPRIIISL